MEFHIVPQPVALRVQSDTPVFRLTYLCNLNAEESDVGTEMDLRGFFEKIFELELLGSGKTHITLRQDPALGHAEGYRLTVTDDHVDVCGADADGLFYGVQTLKQLLLQGKLELPALEIEDWPRFAYRGFLLDVSRHFFAPDSVKLFLDAMALHKLNRLHLHLTDDQGWRVEIYAKLLLAQVGGFRANTNGNGKAHGGFFSKADVEDLVAYAKARHIEIVPEIDLPGHTVSALAAYPELACFPRDFDVATHFGIHHDVLCAGKEQTYNFVFSVLDEVCEQFPAQELHIGGDEVPLHRWAHCPACQARIRAEGLGDEKGLYAAFMNRVAAYCQTKGVRVFAWQNKEIAPAALPGVVREFWDSTPDTDAPYIDANNRAFYFDKPYGKIDLAACYAYEPTAAGRTPYGVEACLWTEWVPSLKRAGYCAFPRLGAFSETAWSPAAAKDFGRFVQKLPAYGRLLDTLPMPHASKAQAMPNVVRKYASLLSHARWRLYAQDAKRDREDKRLERMAKEL